MALGPPAAVGGRERAWLVVATPESESSESVAQGTTRRPPTASGSPPTPCHPRPSRSPRSMSPLAARLNRIPIGSDPIGRAFQIVARDLIETAPGARARVARSGGTQMGSEGGVSCPARPIPMTQRSGAAKTSQARSRPPIPFGRVPRSDRTRARAPGAPLLRRKAADVSGSARAARCSGAPPPAARRTGAGWSALRPRRARARAGDRARAARAR